MKSRALPSPTTVGVVEAFDLRAGLGAATILAIPALSDWEMNLLAALLAGRGVLALRR